MPEKTYKSFGDMNPQGRGNPGPPERGGQGRPPNPAGGGRGHGYGERRPSDLPEKYLASGYFDDKGHVRRELFIEWPEQITDALTDFNARPKASKNSLRAFYSMLRMAKIQFDAQRGQPDKAWGDAKTQLYKLRVAAEYQSTRKVISPLCQKFLFQNIDTVLERGKTSDDFAQNFNAFVEHFQSVIAYLPEKAER
jgi:CRISPR type III-A-associated protein Csm2